MGEEYIDHVGHPYCDDCGEEAPTRRFDASDGFECRLCAYCYPLALKNRADSAVPGK